jgi:DNA-binding NtrC family response regulator
MKKVLVVDDIEDYLYDIETYLEGDYEVLLAKSKKEALEILEKNEISLAILDIRLDENEPDNQEGLELLKWMKKNKPDTPVITMSAYQEFDYAVDALNLGAEYFMKKPISPDKLTKMTKELIG